MQILILIIGIVLLILLITLLKVNAAISLLLAALLVGIANKMPLLKVMNAILHGVTGTLGPLVLIIVLGVIFGNLLNETGAAQQISQGLIRLFGIKYIKLAMVCTGFVVGIAMFYNAAFIILLPLIFSVSASTGQPLVYIAISLVSALSVTHGFLPPHPGPTAIAAIFRADMGKTLLYGIVAATPAIIAAGIFFPETLKKIIASPPPGIFEAKIIEEKDLPSFALSIFTALIPVLLIGLSALASLLPGTWSAGLHVLQFLGNPSTALLTAVLFALIFLALIRKLPLRNLFGNAGASLKAVLMIILLIGAGGAFKQVLIDSGTGTSIADHVKNLPLSPLLLGWLLATIIRIALGSATVAALTAAGMVLPLMAIQHVSPELMVLAIGAGSLMCGHVNDTAFWMFKEYMGLSLKNTFLSWTLMETIVGVTGLCAVLILNLFL